MDQLDLAALLRQARPTLMRALSLRQWSAQPTKFCF